MSRSNSGSYRVRASDGGPLASFPMLQQSQGNAMHGNHNGAQNVDTAQRLAERARIVRAAMNYSARQLLIALSPSQRSESETMFLKDCDRDRRAVTAENMALIMVLQDRAEAHFLSENFRGVEVRGRDDLARECLDDLSDREQIVDAEGDALQLKLREKSPARLKQITEVGPRIIAAWRRMIDAANHQLARVS